MLYTKMVERVIFLDKNLEISLLFDFYGVMLSDTQQQAVNLYYNDDLSLKETADILSMSRQGVRDALNRAQNILYDYEEKLRLCERFSKNKLEFEKILSCSNEIEELTSDEKIITLAKDIKQTAQKLFEQEV